ncbi:MAG: RNA-binding S4 domain-containing protein [Bacteroidota bacterium]
MAIFTLEGHDFIELNKLLKIMNLASSGGEANQLITEGYVSVNGVIETQKRKKLREGDTVELDGEVVEVK